MALSDWWNKYPDPLNQGYFSTPNRPQAITQAHIEELMRKFQLSQMAQMQSMALRGLHGIQWPLEEKLDPNRGAPKSEVELKGILPGDGKAVGYIYGYRAWYLDITVGVLQSDNFVHKWEPKVAQRAEDKKSDFGKGAGIYAAKELAQIEASYKPNPVEAIFSKSRPYVIGKVALWGAIKEHKKGYRAEWAYPVQFLKIYNVAPHLEVSLLRVLSEMYLPR